MLHNSLYFIIKLINNILFKTKCSVLFTYEVFLNFNTNTWENSVTHVTFDITHVTFDITYVTFDITYVTFDTGKEKPHSV